MKKLSEVELRILLKNRKKIEQEVKKLGAEVISNLKIKDYWYCPKSIKSYKEAQIDNLGFALRVREVRDCDTNKESFSLDCKTLISGKNHALCNEYEVDLNSSKQIKKILENIGFKLFLLLRKSRVVYKYKNLKFYFDKIKGIGDGLEIESMTREDEKKVYNNILNLAFKLGISPNEILDKSLTYLAMKKLARF